MIGAEPVIEKRRWLSPVWLLPFIALLLAGASSTSSLPVVAS